MCVYSTAETDLVADVAAFVPAGATGITMLPSPRRILDTRIGLGGPDLPIGGAVRSLQVTGVVGVPASASAALVNLTATEGTGAGFAAAFPCGVGVPLVSNLNFAVGQNVANAAIVKLAADGTMCLNSNLSVDMVVDVTGYVTGTGALVPITPSRLLDTREGVEPACGFGVRRLGLGESPTPGVELYDLATGASRGGPVGLPGFAVISSIMPTLDCRVEISGNVGTAAVWIALDSRGKVVEQRVQPQPYFFVMRSAFGGLALVNAGTGAAVVDTRTFQPLFTLPEFNTGFPRERGPGGYRPLGVTDDESLFAFAVRFDDGRSGSIYVDGDGALVGALEFPPGRSAIAMSPDGSTLLMFDELRTPRSFLVTTLDGDEIAAVGEDRFAPELSPFAFMTSGAIVGCAPGATESLRWDVFTGPKPLSPAARIPCGVVGT